MIQDIEKLLIPTIQKQANRIQNLCTSKKISPNIVVHEIRKSFKRIRALHHFYAEIPQNSLNRYEEETRRFGRELSIVRESYVNVQIFDNEIDADLIADKQRLKFARRKLLKKNVVELEDKFAVNGLISEIQKFIKDFELHLNTTDWEPSKKQLWNQISLSYQKSYDIYQLPELEQTPAKLHELRKKMKRLWYQLDFVKSGNPDFFRLKTNRLRGITEQLGRDHDLHVFIEELYSGNYNLDNDDLQIFENYVQHLCELNHKKLRPKLKIFFTELPGNFNDTLPDNF